MHAPVLSPSDKVELFVVERAVERFGDACLRLGKGGVVHEAFGVGAVGAGNAAHVSEILAEREVAVDVQREVLVARSGHVERLVRLHHTRRAVLERFLHLLVKDRVECARGVVLRALVVGRVVQLVAEHAANAAVVERTGRIAVVERAAQNAGWQRDRVVRRVVVRVHGLWRHLPFVHCRFAEFGNVHAYRLAAQRLHIAIVVVRRQCDAVVLRPRLRVTNEFRDFVQFEFGVLERVGVEPRDVVHAELESVNDIVEHGRHCLFDLFREHLCDKHVSHIKTQSISVQGTNTLHITRRQFSSSR
mmetsp:Transcript_17981/g.31466  ORF Transcript_17981/g.31466 Transcript_17981/m.31466 type:complete len:303 (-) Transcript_17981:1447-2355(-)